jgi:hypothetical protein
VLFAAGRSLDEFLGQTERRSRAAKLVLISYFAGSVPLILSTLPRQGGSYLILVSAIPATLGGTVFLPYTILCVGNARPTTKPVPFTPRKSLPWYVAGAIALLILRIGSGPRCASVITDWLWSLKTMLA